MRHRKKLKKLGLPKDHRTSLLRNLTTSLIMNERLQTTEGRAKALAAHFGRLMTHAKKKEQRELIRLAPRYLYGTTASRKLVAELAKKYADRSSGFTRIIRVGQRAGDNANLVQIELV